MLLLLLLFVFVCVDLGVFIFDQISLCRANDLKFWLGDSEDKPEPVGEERDNQVKTLGAKPMVLNPHVAPLF